MRQVKSITERFFEKVSIPDDPDACWEWMGARYANGYGSFGIEIDGVWIAKPASRISYMINIGDIPTGMMVCHTCDNPPCTNPKHLFLGTQKDNMADAARKGRMNTPDRKGSNNGNAKLTKEMVIIIRKRSDNGESRTSLSKELGIPISTISQVARRKTWPNS